MRSGTRYVIDDTDQIPPHVRLCHRILSEGLTGGLAAVELAAPPGSTPTARAERDGAWKQIMAFPPAVYALLVARFKLMADLAPDADGVEGTILVRVAGRDASVTVDTRRNDQGLDELVLRFGRE